MNRAAKIAYEPRVFNGAVPRLAGCAAVSLFTFLIDRLTE